MTRRRIEEKNIYQSFAILEDLVADNNITKLISQTEKDLNDKAKGEVISYLTEQKNNENILKSALCIKKIIGQIDIIIHAWGILASLPYILKDDEIVISLSLGAGNTGKNFDLETNERVAEFKFIKWRGGPESMRKKGLFKDFFYLVEKGGNKKKYLYLLDIDIPNTFFHSKTAISSLVNRNQKLRKDFYDKYGEKYSIVSEYYLANKDKVEVINLRNIVPELWS